MTRERQLRLIAAVGVLLVLISHGLGTPATLTYDPTVFGVGLVMVTVFGIGLVMVVYAVVATAWDYVRS